jgi:hypothetical protein
MIRQASFSRMPHRVEGNVSRLHPLRSQPCPSSSRGSTSVIYGTKAISSTARTSTTAYGIIVRAALSISLPATAADT